MKEKTKHRLRVLAVSVFVLIFLVFPLGLYALLRLGFPPVIGNLLSARAMVSYAAQVYPDWTPEGNWATYNLVDGYYWLSFSDGAQSHSLGYADKTVRDDEREAALRAELDINKVLRINGLQGTDGLHTYWSAHWSVKEPEEAQITVRVDFYDSKDVPIPGESAMREKMADQAMEVYEALAPAAPIHTVSVGYCHQAVAEEHNRNVWNIIRTDLTEGASLSREQILSGKLITK